MLLLLLINDLNSGIDSAVLKFADDTNIFRIVDSAEDSACLQMDLTNLGEWSQVWNMLFNAIKCKVLHIGNLNHHFKYSMLDCQLSEVEEERDLGVIISSDIKSAKQYQLSCAKANRMLGMIKRNIYYKSRKVMVRLYKSLVRP